MTVDVRIEQLVIDGLPIAPHQAQAFQAALTAELARLAASAGLPSRSANRPRERVDALPPPRHPTPAAWAAQVARAVYGGLSR